MAINKNHEVGELAGTRCAIVEKGVTKDRAEFLKKILEFNHYTVILAPVVAKAVKPVAEGETPPAVEEKFDLGVTDLKFNSINAIFGRWLFTPEDGGHYVTWAYWLQKDAHSHDEIPYYEEIF